MASQPKTNEPTVSRQLMNAALSGLLCLSASSCTTTKAVDGTATGPGEITSTQHVEALDEAGFTQLCDARGGTVEVMPHCGGFATAKGFSYDLTTSTLAEHSCKGANTCAGWNCVIAD